MPPLCATYLYICETPVAHLTYYVDITDWRTVLYM